MGRVNSQSPATAPSTEPEQPLTHFTHPHELHPLPVYSLQSVCSGCRLQSSGTMYACLPCAFTLHQSCAKLPTSITHPSHTGCILSLLTVPAYAGTAFTCNACGRRGEGWSFHCSRCEYDLHVSCASKPMKIRHVGHVSCPLNLTFGEPYPGAGGFSCDACRRNGGNQWLYRCHSCQFDVHLDCVANPGLQHHHSLPRPSAPTYHNQLMHTASSGGIRLNLNPGQGYGPGRVPVQGSGPAAEGNLVTAAVQGLLEGAFQEMGQIIVQGFIG